MKKFICALVFIAVNAYTAPDAVANQNNIYSDGPTATFILNGDTATLPALFEDSDPITGDFYLSSKKLSVNIAARVKPEVTLTLKIFITEFDEKTLQQGNAIGMLLRRNSSMENLLTYSSNLAVNGKQGSFKLTITKFTILSLPSKNQYGEAIVSGDFESDLNCSSGLCAQGETQHIVSGRFENVKIAIWK